MSSIYTTFNNSTAFNLLNGKTSERAIDDLIVLHMDDYKVYLNRCDSKFILAFDGAEVGPSFNERVRNLAKAMAPHVKDAFMVQVRENTMSDDRDEDVFGGPDEATIQAFAHDFYLKEAIEILNKHSESPYYRALRLAMVGELVNPREINVVATIEGGNLTDITATHPIKAFKVDYDIDGADESELVDVPQEPPATPGKTEKAFACEQAVSVLPASCESVIAAIEDAKVELQRERCA